MASIIFEFVNYNYDLDGRYSVQLIVVDLAIRAAVGNWWGPRLFKLPKPTGVGANFRTAGISYISRRDFPTWHYAMLNDEPRNRAIERAIADLPLDGKSVVEIGTGTGLIALLFARHGAERVITCEMNQNLASVARQIVNATPYGDRITVIDKSSTLAIAECLIEVSPDYIFTETLDCGVVGESFFDIARDIQFLAGPNTQVLPGEIRQIGVVIQSQDMLDLNSVTNVCGFDLSALNAFSTETYFPVREQLHDYDVLSAPTILRRHDYLSNEPATSRVVEVKQDGCASGIMTWMEIEFGNHLFSNEPGTMSHWHKAFHPLVQPMQLQRGQELELTIDDAGRARACLFHMESFDRVSASAG